MSKQFQLLRESYAMVMRPNHATFVCPSQSFYFNADSGTFPLSSTRLISIHTHQAVQRV
jgi:hypothetical protein